LDKVFDESGTSQDEEDQEDALRIELQNYLKEKRSPCQSTLYVGGK
jgi:hypothetical protein